MLVTGSVLAQRGRVLRGTTENAQSPRYTYAGVAVVAPRLVAGVRSGQKAPLAPLLYAAADADLDTAAP